MKKQRYSGETEDEEHLLFFNLRYELYDDSLLNQQEDVESVMNEISLISVHFHQCRPGRYRQAFQLYVFQSWPSLTKEVCFPICGREQDLSLIHI